MTIVFEESGVEARSEKNRRHTDGGSRSRGGRPLRQRRVLGPSKRPSTLSHRWRKPIGDESYFEKMAFVAECVEVRRFLKMPPWLSEARDEEDAGSQWGRVYRDLEIDQRVLAIARVFSQRLDGWEGAMSEARSVLVAYLDLRKNSVDPLAGIARAICGDGARTG